MSDVRSDVKRVVRALKHKAKGTALAVLMMSFLALGLAFVGKHFGLIDLHIVVLLNLLLVPIGLVVGWLLGVLEVEQKLEKENII